MSVSLEQIDLLRERAHVSYKEAKEVLESCQGNLVDAMVILENRNRGKKMNDQRDRRKEAYESRAEIKNGFRNFWKALWQTRLSLVKENESVVDVPVFFVLLGVCFFFVPALILWIVGMCFDCKLLLSNVDMKEAGWMKMINVGLKNAFNLTQEIKSNLTSK